MKKFKPFYDKIEIKPLKKEGVIMSDSTSLIEAGEVVSIGDKVTFVKVGDIIYFDSWGCSKTPNDNYVVSERSEMILGKDSEEDQETLL